MSAKEATPQPMPVERSILWSAASDKSRESQKSRAPYPIFFQQEAVVALHEHLKGSPQQAIFGFLIGNLFRDPESGVLFPIIDKTLRLNQAIYGDKTEVVVERLWARMQQQLERAAGLLLGWYHSHPGQGGFLTAHDVTTHEKFFTDPWQVAILVAAEAGGVTGRFFRSSQNPDWHKTPLPFYELLPPESIKEDGKKRSFIMWRNYKAFHPPVTKRAPPPAPEPEPEPPAPPPAAKRPSRPSPIDDLPLIRTSADDEPAPARPIVPSPPRAAPPPPPPSRR
ncbi:MAG: hypothetical protein Q8Q14_11340, partial [Gemmatimonadales bacterium]|nr:hypothetical protein [Gemmatimonadales bacterium]